MKRISIIILAALVTMAFTSCGTSEPKFKKNTGFSKAHNSTVARSSNGTYCH